MRPCPQNDSSRPKRGGNLLAALLFSALVVFVPACTEAQKQRQSETAAGARTLEVAGSLVRNPTMGNALKEGLSLAQTWLYVLTGIGGTGGAVLLARNRKSNKRKTDMEGRLGRAESAIAALGQLAKDQAARAEGGTA